LLNSLRNAAYFAARFRAMIRNPSPPCFRQVATPRSATLRHRIPVVLAVASHSRRLVRPGLNAVCIRESRQLIFPEPEVLPIAYTPAQTTVANCLRQLRQFSIPYRDGEELSRRLSPQQYLHGFHDLRSYLHAATDQKSELSPTSAMYDDFANCRELSHCRRSFRSVVILRHITELSQTVAFCRDPPKPFLASDFVELNHLSRTVAALVAVLPD
jgi:hypothetical protein